MSTYAPFAKPLYVMLKPVGAVCNLACDYCYYLEKSRLYQENPKHVMSDELLEKFIEQYINSQTMPQVLFTWHGGETLMRPLSFYKKAMELQKKYARGRSIDNCIQTNGTLLTDEWCEFFRENNWLVGVSIDGPQEFHDEYPLVKFDIYVGNADLIKERVDQGLVDIGILLEPVDISKYNHLRIPLQEKWGIIVSKTNSLAHKPYVKKEDLKELPLFLTNREIVQSEISNWLKGDVSLHSMFSYNFASAILPFIQDDQGAAITVEGAYQVLNQKNICFIPFYPELSTNTVFIWKKYTRLSPVIDRFIKKVQEYLEKSRSLYEK